MNGQTTLTRLPIIEPPRRPHWSKTKTFAVGFALGCLFVFFADAFINGMHVTIETRCLK